MDNGVNWKITKMSMEFSESYIGAVKLRIHS